MLWEMDKVFAHPRAVVDSLSDCNAFDSVSAVSEGASGDSKLSSLRFLR